MRHFTATCTPPHPPASGLPRSFKLSGDAAASHAAHNQGDGGGEARKRVRIACRRRKHARQGALAKGENRRELYAPSFLFFVFKVLLALFFFPFPPYSAAAPAWIRSAQGDQAQSWGQEQSASKETRHCNSVQLQRVSLQSMIWTLVPLILTCFGG